MVNLRESELKSILPDYLKKDAYAQAFCYAFDNQIKKILDKSSMLEVWSNLYNADVLLLDYLAAELRTQYYYSELDTNIKRKLLTNTLIWYQKAGTVAAVEELVSTLFDTGKVQEWYEYGGQPHHFKIQVSNPLINDISVKKFHDIIDNIKRKTAILDALEVFIREFFNVTISTDTKLHIESDFYPRYNLPLLLLDGSWQLDGAYSLNGYKTNELVDFYPVNLGLKSEVDARPEIEASLTVEKDLWYLDGTYLLDGTKILDAEIIMQTL